VRRRIPSLSEIRRLVSESRFLRSVGVLVGGTAAGQVVLLLVSPVVTRLYVPAEYGTLAAFTALLFLLIPVSALRFELTVPLTDDEEDAVGSLVISLGALALVLLLTVGCVWIFGEAIAHWIDAPDLEGLLWLLPAGLALGGGSDVFTHWAIRRGDFGVISRSEVSRPVAKAASQVGLGVAGWGAAGLVTAEILGRIGGILPLARQAWEDTRGYLRAVDRAMLSRLVRRYWRFPVLTGGGTLLGGTAANLPALLMAGLFGAQAAGWLALGQRVVASPVSFFAEAVRKVYVGRAADLAGTDGRALRRLFLRTALLLFGIGVGPALILFLAGPPLFGLIFGDAWQEAGRYARLLSPLFLCRFVLWPLASTLDLLERQLLKFAVMASRLVLVVAAFLVPWRWELGASAAVAAYGTGWTLLYLVLFFLTLRAIPMGEEDRPGGGRPDGEGRTVESKEEGP